eukprot:scaffold65058_cov17-Tisochrysis_lutea.AAC.2
MQPAVRWAEGTSDGAWGLPGIRFTDQWAEDMSDNECGLPGIRWTNQPSSLCLRRKRLAIRWTEQPDLSCLMVTSEEKRWHSFSQNLPSRKKTTTMTTYFGTPLPYPHPDRLQHTTATTWTHLGCLCPACTLTGCSTQQRCPSCTLHARTHAAGAQAAPYMQEYMQQMPKLHLTGWPIP